MFNSELWQSLPEGSLMIYFTFPCHSYVYIYICVYIYIYIYLCVYIYVPCLSVDMRSWLTFTVSHHQRDKLSMIFLLKPPFSSGMFQQAMFDDTRRFHTIYTIPKICVKMESYHSKNMDVYAVYDGIWQYRYFNLWLRFRFHRPKAPIFHAARCSPRWLRWGPSTCHRGGQHRHVEKT